MKKRIHLISVLFNFFCFANASFGQTISQDNRIIVLGEAKIDVPANRVQFTVSYSASDESSLDTAYKNHYAMEKKLLRIFKDMNIPDANVKFALLSVNKHTDYQTKKMSYQCDQTVNFSIDSIKLTTKVEELLVRNGFYNFKSQFLLKDYDKQKKEVLEKAVKVAQDKAQTMASMALRRVKRIIKIMDTEETDPKLSNYSRSYVIDPATKSSGIIENSNRTLIDIPQTISISTTVKVVFELE
jgi:hypothetical protein